METDVLIVGAGPSGITLANLLGTYGVRTIIIDRNLEIIDYPRGVGVDDESLRVFQAAGMAEEVHRDMVQNQSLIWFDSKFNKLAQISPTGEPFGWPRRNSFLQPLLEKTLRTGLERFEHVALKSGYELGAIDQHEDGVIAHVTNTQGEKIEIASKFLVGTDGGRSTVRKNIGVRLVGTSLAARWLVVDIRDSEYHAPFSGNYINSDRPFVSIDLPYGYRRFEFRLQPDEREEEMVKPEAVERLIKQHFNWTGPLAGIERARVYTHHSRVADRFRVGRVFLAGDAAHLQPPWFGQGMNSGIRDVANLSWKLAAVLNNNTPETILETYETERKSHAKALVELATTLGKVYGPRNKFGEKIRSYGLRALSKVPSIRDYFLQMRFKPMPYYSSGIVVEPEESGPIGRMFIQPDVELQSGERMKLDEAVGDWFAVIGINVDPVQQMTEDSLAYWTDLGARFVRVNRSRAGDHLRESDPKTLILDDVSGGFRDWQFGSRPNDVIVLRPDRYVAGVASLHDLDSLTSKFMKILPYQEKIHS